MKGAAGETWPPFLFLLWVVLSSLHPVRPFTRQTLLWAKFWAKFRPYYFLGAVMIATSDIRPITQLKTSAAELVDEAATRGRTLVITQHGEARAVLMGAAQYDKWRQAFALLQLVGRSKVQHRSGKSRSSEAVFARLEETIAAIENERRQKTSESR